MHSSSGQCAQPDLMTFLSLKGPEIRTGFLKDGKPIQLTTGKEVTITTDYEHKGDESSIAVR